MASAGRPWDFGSDPPTGSGRAWGSLHPFTHDGIDSRFKFKGSYLSNKPYDHVYY